MGLHTIKPGLDVNISLGSPIEDRASLDLLLTETLTQARNGLLRWGPSAVLPGPMTPTETNLEYQLVPHGTDRFTWEQYAALTEWMYNYQVVLGHRAYCAINVEGPMEGRRHCQLGYGEIRSLGETRGGEDEWSPAAIPNPLSLSSFKECLKLASYRGNLSQARSILKTWNSACPVPSPTPADLGPPLDAAVISGHVSIVRLLLDLGAPITISTNAFVTTHDLTNTLPILEAFLEHGWSVQSTANKNGPMTMCLAMSHPDGESLLQWFLSNGASANGLPSDPGAPFRCVRTPAMVTLLLSHGANIKHMSALHAVAARGNDATALPLLKSLLDNGADIDELQYEGRNKLPREASGEDHGTALHLAAGEGSVKMAKFLVERGADLAKRSKNGYTARDWAQLDKKEEVKTYLEGIMRERGLDFRELEVEEEEEEEEEG